MVRVGATQGGCDPLLFLMIQTCQSFHGSRLLAIKKILIYFISFIYFQCIKITNINSMKIINLFSLDGECNGRWKWVLVDVTTTLVYVRKSMSSSPKHGRKGNPFRIMSFYRTCQVGFLAFSTVAVGGNSIQTGWVLHWKMNTLLGLILTDKQMDKYNIFSSLEHVMTMLRNQKFNLHKIDSCLAYVESHKGYDSDSGDLTNPP